MRTLTHLVSGTGRSGTVFLARLLTSVGILCGHESIFDYRGIEISKRRLSGELPIVLSGCSGDKYDPVTNTCTPVFWHPNVAGIVADSSYMSAPYLKDDMLSTTLKIHAVRNPVAVIDSFCNSINYFSQEIASNVEDRIDYEKFIFEQLPELSESMPQYDRAALYYILWNQMIENSNPNVFFRVEDNPRILLDKLGVGNDVHYFNDQKVNTFKRMKSDVFDSSKLQVKDIKVKLFDLADKYNYKIRNITFM